MSEVVYHYTSPQGALSILQNKTLWFTDCQYLNDKSEIVYSREPFLEAYKKISEERDEPYGDLVDSFFATPYEERAISSLRTDEKPRIKITSLRITKYRYYVLCASNKDDTACMWGNYVKNGAYHGYNLGLDTNVIQEWFFGLNDKSVKLLEGSVVYDRERQVKKIYSKLRKLFNDYDKKIQTLNVSEDDISAVEDFQERLYEYVSECKLFFKNPAFANEKEYRFVLRVGNDYRCNGNLGIKYRVGTSGIITPYIEWCFNNLKSKLLKQITLAPMIESELAQESFKRFLANDVYNNITIKPSSIKLRY